MQPLGEQCGMEEASALAGYAALPALRRTVFAALAARNKMSAAMHVRADEWLKGCGRSRLRGLRPEAP